MADARKVQTLRPFTADAPPQPDTDSLSGNDLEVEDMTAASSNHLKADTNAAPTASEHGEQAGQVDGVENDPDTNKARINDGTDKMDQDVEDDILSIMCDDNDIDHLDLDEEEKRDWLFECGLRSTKKRKSDSPVNTSSASRPKRCRTESFSSRSERKLPSNSVHSRLGPRPKHYQYNEQNNNPCYKFLKTGSCYRPSCPLLHIQPTPQDNTMENRYQQAENSDKMLLAQYVQQELHQMKKQQNFLLHHVQHNEVLLKHHAVNQAQVYTNLQNFYRKQQQEFQNKLSYNQSVLIGKLHSINNIQFKNLQGIDERLKEVESAMKTKEELLDHYKYITSIQEKQMEYITSGCIINDPSKRSFGHKCKLPSWPSMMEMHYKKDSTKPRSDDNHLSTRFSQNGRLVDSETNRPQRLYLRQPLITADTRGLIERPVYNVAGNPHLMPFIPMRHFNGSVYDYQHASVKSKVPYT